MAAVSYEGYIRRQTLHLEFVHPKLDCRLNLKGIDNLSLVKDSPGAAELSKVVRKQPGKFFK